MLQAAALAITMRIMAFKLVTSVELFCCLVSWLVLIRLGLVVRVVRLPKLAVHTFVEAVALLLALFLLLLLLLRLSLTLSSSWSPDTSRVPYDIRPSGTASVR